MNKYIKSIIAVLLCSMMVSTVSCSEKENASSTLTEKSTSAQSSEPTDGKETNNNTTADSADITTVTTEPVTVTLADNGYASAQEAAQNYYNAYITNNYEAIYDMFSTDEINSYYDYVDSLGIIGEEKAEKAFGKGNMIKAIKASIGNIRSIMAEKSDKPAEQWGTTFKPEDLKAVSPDELAQYNASLGTAFTNAMNCEYVYYTDGDDRNSFVGNACSLVEKDGRWYLAFSTLLSAEYVTFLDVF